MQGVAERPEFLLPQTPCTSGALAGDGWHVAQHAYESFQALPLMQSDTAWIVASNGYGAALLVQTRTACDLQLAWNLLSSDAFKT